MREGLEGARYIAAESSEALHFSAGSSTPHIIPRGHMSSALEPPRKKKTERRLPCLLLAEPCRAIRHSDGYHNPRSYSDVTIKTRIIFPFPRQTGRVACLLTGRPGVQGGPVGAEESARPHAELVHVGFTEQRGPRLSQALNGRGVVRRREFGEGIRGCGRGHA